MTTALDLAPLAATVFALPQFLPQAHRALRTGDVAGVSWPWAALTAVGNAGWAAYFASSGYWWALVPSSSTTALATVLAGSITRLGGPDSRGRSSSRVVVATWAAVLVGSFLAWGPAGLGTALSAAFVVQVAPALWTAYRSPSPTGIAATTWLLVLGELSCWGAYGLHRSDRRLILLGASGILASVLMLIRWAGARRPTCPDVRTIGPAGSTAPFVPSETGADGGACDER